ncbi:MAG TPA: M48 family metallopeptidase [Candidatus Peribacteria bacterium]|nr:M48 family metallopeptidase [Candidatus Peribacteria bacterium]
MTDSPLPYRIERTRNRWSRATCNEETIVIRLARGLSTAEEQQHIDNLLGRIGKAFTRMQRRTLIDPFRPLVNGEVPDLAVTVSSGRSYRFTLTEAKRFRAEQTSDGWVIQAPANLSRTALHRQLWHCISLSEYHEMVALIDAINQDTLVLNVRDVKLRFAKSKWGSCSGTGTIMLNAALLFVPRTALHYVIVHELAHMIHPNHSARFWATVERAMPGYALERKALREYRLPKL